MVDRPPEKPAASRHRVALAHDWLVGVRGGEQVLERIAAIVKHGYTPGPLCVLVASHKADRLPLTASFETITSSLQRIPGAAGRLRRWLLPMYPRAVDKLSARLAAEHEDAPIRVLFSTSSGLIKGLDAPGKAWHVCYCHSPPRYLWHAEAEYRAGKGLGALLRRIGFSLYGERLRAWDLSRLSKVDAFIANSTHTASKIREIYNREARVIHPPVRTDLFTPDPSVSRDNFWLVVSAMEPYKRVDLAIEAAMTAAKRLIIVGDGSQMKQLRAHAKRYAKHLKKVGMGGGRDALVEFLGRVPDAQLIGLYRRARCLIFPQEEDFGIIAAEAQACGCPVVARRAGGAIDIVLEGRTGIFFNAPTPDAIIKAVERCPSDVDEQCRASAERFSEQRFDQEIKTVIEEAIRM
jgi:glycosyltransferase involved in cell wall biosynthesis